MFFKNVPDKNFPGQFGGGVNAEGIGAIRFRIGLFLGAVENIIRTEMDKAAAQIPAGHGQIPDGDGIDPEGFSRISLAFIHPVIGSRVDDEIRTQPEKLVPGFVRLGDIEIREAEWVQPVLPKKSDQV
jgi:hypothetical protein